MLCIGNVGEETYCRVHINVCIKGPKENHDNLIDEIAYALPDVV